MQRSCRRHKCWKKGCVTCSHLENKLVTAGHAQKALFFPRGRALQGEEGSRVAKEARAQPLPCGGDSCGLV